MRNQMRTSNWFRDVDDMFRTFAQPTWTPAFTAWEPKTGFSPAVDVQETEKEYLFQMDLPGLNEKDLNISFVGRELQVTGERRKEEATEGTRHHRSERFFGKFEKTFLLPEDVNSEKIEAQFKNGVLQIRVPKVEAAQPKTIQIQVQ